MIESTHIVSKSLLFKIINYHIYLSHYVIPYVLFKEIIYNNFNLINEWSIMDILYNITFSTNLILD